MHNQNDVSSQKNSPEVQNALVLIASQCEGERAREFINKNGVKNIDWSQSDIKFSLAYYYAQSNIFDENEFITVILPYLASKKVSIDTSGPCGHYSMLHILAHHGRISSAVICMMFKCGMLHLNYKMNSSDITALVLSIQKKKFESALVLLEFGARITDDCNIIYAFLDHMEQAKSDPSVLQLLADAYFCSITDIKKMCSDISEVYKNPNLVSSLKKDVLDVLADLKQEYEIIVDGHSSIAPHYRITGDARKANLINLVQYGNDEKVAQLLTDNYSKGSKGSRLSAKVAFEEQEEIEYLLYNSLYILFRSGELRQGNQQVIYRLLEYLPNIRAKLLYISNAVEKHCKRFIKDDGRVLQFDTMDTRVAQECLKASEGTFQMSQRKITEIISCIVASAFVHAIPPTKKSSVEIIEKTTRSASHPVLYDTMEPQYTALPSPQNIYHETAIYTPEDQNYRQMVQNRDQSENQSAHQLLCSAKQPSDATLLQLNSSENKSIHCSNSDKLHKAEALINQDEAINLFESLIEVCIKSGCNLDKVQFNSYSAGLNAVCAHILHKKMHQTNNMDFGDDLPDSSKCFNDVETDAALTTTQEKSEHVYYATSTNPQKNSKYASRRGISVETRHALHNAYTVLKSSLQHICDKNGKKHLLNNVIDYIVCASTHQVPLIASTIILEAVSCIDNDYCSNMLKNRIYSIISDFDSGSAHINLEYCTGILNCFIKHFPSAGIIVKKRLESCNEKDKQKTIKCLKLSLKSCSDNEQAFDVSEQLARYSTAARRSNESSFTPSETGAYHKSAYCSEPHSSSFFRNNVQKPTMHVDNTFVPEGRVSAQYKSSELHESTFCRNMPIIAKSSVVEILTAKSKDSVDTDTKYSFPIDQQSMQTFLQYMLSSAFACYSSLHDESVTIELKQILCAAKNKPRLGTNDLETDSCIDAMQPTAHDCSTLPSLIDKMDYLIKKVQTVTRQPFGEVLALLSEKFVQIIFSDKSTTDSKILNLNILLCYTSHEDLITSDQKQVLKKLKNTFLNCAGTCDNTIKCEQYAQMLKCFLRYHHKDGIDVCSYIKSHPSLLQKELDCHLDKDEQHVPSSAALDGIELQSLSVENRFVCQPSE